MNIQFSFQIRMAMRVAIAIAEHVGDPRPTLLSIQNGTFRFERGIVVKPEMIELSQFNESWRKEPQEWVVTSATVRHYELDREGERISDQKVEEIWDHTRLLEVKQAHFWHHPRVVDPTSIKGRVGFFWDNGAAHGYVDKSRLQSGRSLHLR